MLRYVFLSLCLLAPAVPAQAAPVPQADSGSSGTLYKLEGVVVNSETGRPVPRALVEIFLQGKHAMLTNGEGEFSFDKLVKGTAQIRSEKPGFFEPGRAGQQAYTLRNIEIGAQTEKLVLKLEPECVISGEVVNENGEPLEGAVVEALAFRISVGRRELMPARSNVRTDEDGLFRMAGLPSGKYILGVRAWGAGRRLLGAESGKVYPVSFFYPGVPDIASATSMELVPGQHTQVQFSVSPVQAFKLSGTISGVQGLKQVGNPMLVDSNERPLFTTSHWDAQTGVFEFPPLPAGTYTLRVYAAAEEGRPTTVRQSIVLNHDITGLSLSLQAGATIPVTVRTEFNSTTQSHCFTSGFTHGSSMSEAECTKFPAMIFLAPAESRRTQFRAEAENGDPATLALRNVAPGRYHVEVSSMGNGYVRSVHSGGTDLMQEELIVPAGGSIPPIEVVLRDDGAKVKVHVQTENFPDHVTVLLFAESAPFQRPQMMTLSSPGDRELGNLAPGDYKVLAFEALHGGGLEYSNPEFISKYSSKTARVTLPANGSANVTVELIRAGE